MSFLAALLIGVIAGLRAMTAPAAVGWAAALGWMPLEDRLAFLGYCFTPDIFTILAIAELVTDQLPSTPSRKVPLQFGARIVTGALCGAVFGRRRAWTRRPGCRFIGAVLGTLGGAKPAAGWPRLRQGPARRLHRGRRRHLRRPLIVGRADEPDIRRHRHRRRPGRAALAGRLAAAGHEGRADRAQAVRRHLRQHRLHADQDPGRQRLCRASGAPRRRVRRRRSAAPSAST